MFKFEPEQLLEGVCIAEYTAVEVFPHVKLWLQLKFVIEDTVLEDIYS